MRRHAIQRLGFDEEVLVIDNCGRGPVIKTSASHVRSVPVVMSPSTRKRRREKDLHCNSQAPARSRKEEEVRQARTGCDR